MAASSPAKNNSAAAIDGAATPLSSNSSKSLRGLNKPKCIKCGNVARSRCPFQSCKNCCAKAQNPCHIHVKKGNASFPDKPPSSSSPQFDQQSTDVSHSGSMHRLRHLSNNFAQFNNLQTPFRSRKPLTKKDAQVINEWRFLKLKEFRDGNAEAESGAFDRYMQNVSLLEEVFRVNSAPDDSSIQDKEQSSVGSSTEAMVQGLKLNLKSDPVRSDNLRKRIRYIVDQGLRKKVESIDGGDELSDLEGGRGTRAKKIKCSKGERVMALSDLGEKLNKARNEEDLKECCELASEIFKWNNKTSQTESVQDFPVLLDENDLKSDASTRVLPKWVSPVKIDQEVVCRVDAQFSSIEEIEDL
ncbi:PREDICTED: uncharacterized protein LOC105972116 [Erythranthe guttata]|nr:PREDICTED: uncharacterized protein LOC105972116 [Erythranthe guttata]|eukprot:XP_012852514.1 PREDICTED: uncharacterized protein LOC105972116 [Erythranthe guttata]